MLALLPRPNRWVVVAVAALVLAGLAAGIWAPPAGAQTPGVTISQTNNSTAVSEAGATDTYTVRLDSQPTDTVTITITPGGQLSVAPSTMLMFTTENWDTAQMVTVSAVNDEVVEGTHQATITHSAANGGYDGVVIDNVQVTITDNDTPSVSVTQTGGSTDVTEGGTTDTYTIVLGKQPSGSVTITIATGTQLSVNAPSSQLVFTAANFGTPQNVVVTAVDDLVPEGSHSATLVHTASGGGYTGVGIANITVNITDNDSPTVIVTESGGSTTVTEGGATDTYTIVLGTAPSGDVTIVATSTSQVSVTPSTIVFSPANWNSPRTLTVTAVDDALVEGQHTASITHTASGGGYSGVSIPSVTATITDNDVATVNQSGGSTRVTEGGGDDSYSIVLTSQPSSDVTITLSTVPGNQITVSPQSLTFRPSNWFRSQTITVRAVNDQVVEGTHQATIQHTLSGGGLTGVAVPNVVVTITDNDTPSLTLIETGGATALSESGGSDTYTVALTSQPSTNVTIVVGQDPPNQLAASPNVLTFTPANWNIAQTVFLSAINDSLVEGTHVVTMRHIGNGGGYTEASLPGLEVVITDNDEGGVIVSETGGRTEVAEGGTGDVYTVVLTALPAGNVTVTISTGSDLVAAPSSLVFTPTSWSTPQAVNLSAVDDSQVEDTEIVAVTHVASGGGYSGVPVANVTVTIVDNDEPTFETVPLPFGLELVGWFGTRTTSTAILQDHPAILRIWAWESDTETWIVDDLAVPERFRTTIVIDRGRGFFVVTAEVTTLTVPLN